jgi:hypothetical protein
MDNRGHWLRVNIQTSTEVCLGLSITDLLQAGLLVPDKALSGCLTWHGAQEQAPLASVDVHVAPGAQDGLNVRLRYQVVLGGVPQTVNEPISLMVTQPFFGGQRWWFRCPLGRSGVSCGRRVGVLYLPPEGRLFGCRYCHELTYASCQASRHRGAGELLHHSHLESLGVLR